MNNDFLEAMAICVAILAALILILWLVNISPFFRDDSDLQGWGAPRSGMDIKVDHLTGCQYFSSGRGLVPRITADGKHMGCGETGK